MKTMDERIKEIKHCGECAIYGMEDHKVNYLPDDGSFNNIITSMHNAQSKDKLSEAYYKYINNCIAHGYSDGEIIGGIMQNECKNKEFGVNIDLVIKSLIEIRYTPVKLSESKPVVEKEAIDAPKDKEPEAVAAAKLNPDSNTKAVNKIKKKVCYVSEVLNKLQSNKSENFTADINKVKSICKEIKEIISTIDSKSCTEEMGKDLNVANAAVLEMEKVLETVISNSPQQAQNPTQFTQQQQPQVQSQQIQQSQPQQQQKPQQAQSQQAANNVGGFDISNFIKQQGPIINVNTGQNITQKQSVFPHQIDGLTDDQIIEEIGKHYKLIPENQYGVYPLYDLIKNKYLAKKMKELDAKQRPNNPFLTQVNMTEYIAEPDLLNKYQMCFTMPCNDKRQVIMVLFSPVAVPGNNGALQYPLHIFKAAKTTKQQ